MYPSPYRCLAFAKRTIVLSAAVVNVFEKTKTLDYRQFWLDSNVLRRRNSHRHQGRRPPPHPRRVQRWIAARHWPSCAFSEAMPELYTKVQKGLNGAELMLAEEAEIGLSHTEAGYVLADYWGLPIDIVEPIRFHHKPELATTAKEATAIVAIAEVMARVPGDNVEAWHTALQSLASAFHALNIDMETAEAMFQDYHNLRESCLRDPMF